MISNVVKILALAIIFGFVGAIIFLAQKEEPKSSLLSMQLTAQGSLQISFPTLKPGIRQSTPVYTDPTFQFLQLSLSNEVDVTQLSFDHEFEPQFVVNGVNTDYANFEHSRQNTQNNCFIVLRNVAGKITWNTSNEVLRIYPANSYDEFLERSIL